MLQQLVVCLRAAAHPDPEFHHRMFFVGQRQNFFLARRYLGTTWLLTEFLYRLYFLYPRHRRLDIPLLHFSFFDHTLEVRSFYRLISSFLVIDLGILLRRKIGRA